MKSHLPLCPLGSQDCAERYADHYCGYGIWVLTHLHHVRGLGFLFSPVTLHNLPQRNIRLERCTKLTEDVIWLRMWPTLGLQVEIRMHVDGKSICWKRTRLHFLMDVILQLRVSPLHHPFIITCLHYIHAPLSLQLLKSLYLEDKIQEKPMARI